MSGPNHQAGPIGHGTHPDHAEAGNRGERGTDQAASNRPLSSPSGTATELPPLLTIEDLARIFQRSERQLYRDLAAGRIPAPTITLGKQKLWRWQAIEVFLDAGGRRSRTKHPKGE